MDAHGQESLAKWIVGGLVAGAAVLGIAVGAYAVGYHRGKHHRPASAVAAPPAAATTTSPSGTSAIGPVTVTPALVAQGKTLYTSDGCAACHSLTGASGVGPSLNGIAGTSVALSDGTTVTADDAYLERSITDPDAQIAKGYRAGIMTPGVTAFHLASKPDEIRALVAFIKSQK